MQKFIRKGVYKHINCIDMAIEVKKAFYVMQSHYNKLRVNYVHYKSFLPLTEGSENITIKDKDNSKWKRIL